MRLHAFRPLVAIIFLRYLLSASHAWAGSSVTVPNDSIVQTLTAISIRSNLEKREPNFTPSHYCEHHYADHSTLLQGASARFAKTSINFKLPTLSLEDIESHVGFIECSETTIVVKFSHEFVFEQAKADWSALSNSFLVVSSHPGCNADGARATYMVSGIDYGSVDLTAVLSVLPVEWKNAYHSMTVQFGMTAGSGQYSADGLRFHKSLRRRQTGATSTNSSSTAASSIAYPSAPTSTPSSSSSSKDFNFNNTDPSIFTISETQNGVVTETVTIGCKECSAKGSIEITEGTVVVNSSTSAISQIYTFIESGYFLAAVNNFVAHIELDTSLQLTVSKSFTQDIATLALPGFQIPGIAAVGPQLTVSIHGTISLSSKLDFTYGFVLTVPNSSVKLNIGNLTESSSNGFSNATVTAIPFNANLPDITLTFELGLTTQVLLGVNILDGVGNVHAGAFVDMPYLTLTIASLSDVDAQCESAAPASPAATAGSAYLFPDLLLLNSSATIDVGLEAGADVSVGILQTALDTSTILASTQFALPSTCLMWDSSRSAFVSPTPPSSSTTASALATSAQVAIATASGTAGASKQGAGARTVGDPSEPRRVAWAAGILSGVLLLVMLFW